MPMSPTQLTMREMNKEMILEYPKFEELKGEVIVNIENKNNEELVFTTSNGDIYTLYHEQDCCESVTIDDICGDIDDVIGAPILVAEEVKLENNVNPNGITAINNEGSFTWTFYKLDTIKGGITIRWYGESNGYYSESVSFCRVLPTDAY